MRFFLVDEPSTGDLAVCRSATHHELDHPGPLMKHGLVADGRQQADEQRWTDAGSGGDPLIVDAIEEGGKRLTVARMQDLEVVAVGGEPSDVVAEDVRGDISD